jgi:hypothetical protein
VQIIQDELHLIARLKDSERRRLNQTNLLASLFFVDQHLLAPIRIRERHPSPRLHPHERRLCLLEIFHWSHF